MLEVKNLAVSYGRHRALEGVGITVDKGEICVILGANGAGKSTLLKAIAGMVTTDAGEIIMNGRAITREKPNKVVEAGVALVPEGRGIFGDLSVAENLQLGAFARRARRAEKVTLKTVYELFPRLAERKRQIARTMSGGEQQMVAIGRALMSKPDILMLDEPSLGLSPILTRELFRSLSDVAATGVGILLVEQNAKQSLKIAGRGYLIENGHVTGENSAEALRNDPAVIAAYLGGAAGGHATRPAVHLPPAMPLPAAVAALGRMAGDLAARAGDVSRAFVRSLRRAETLPSAFAGRYDPRAGGDPWQEIVRPEPTVETASTSLRVVAEEARWLAATSGNLARSAAERLARHVEANRRGAAVPSAFERKTLPETEPKASLPTPDLASGTVASPAPAQTPTDMAGRAAERMARHLATVRAAAPLPSAFQRKVEDDASISPASKTPQAQKLNGSRGLLGHNSAAAGMRLDEADTPSNDAPATSIAVAQLAARAEAAQNRHVAAGRRTAPNTNESRSAAPDSPSDRDQVASGDDETSIAELATRAAAIQRRHIDKGRRILTVLTVPAAPNAASKPATPAADPTTPDDKAVRKAARKPARKGKKHKAKKKPAKHQEKR